MKVLQCQTWLTLSGDKTEFWSKEVRRRRKGQRLVKVLSIKRAARLEARQAAAEAEAPLLDSTYGTRCRSAFLEERVRWAESYSTHTQKLSWINTQKLLNVSRALVCVVSRRGTHFHGACSGGQEQEGDCGRNAQRTLLLRTALWTLISLGNYHNQIISHS